MGPEQTASLADNNEWISSFEDYEACVRFLAMLELSYHSKPIGDSRLVVCDELGLIASFDEESGDLKAYGLE